MNAFHALVCLPCWWAEMSPEREIDAQALERALVAAIVIEDEQAAAVSCRVEPLARVWDTRPQEGAFAVHVRALLGEHKGRVRAVIDGESEILLEVLDELRDRAPARMSEHLLAGLVRDMGVRDDQEVQVVRAGEGRHEVRIDGLMAGWVFGSGSRWTAETNRGQSLGRAASLTEAAMLVQIAHGFPDTKRMRHV